jgi:hypothetical protein
LSLNALSTNIQNNYNNDINSLNSLGTTDPINVFGQYDNNSVFAGAGSAASAVNNGTGLTGGATVPGSIPFSQGFSPVSYSTVGTVGDVLLTNLKTNALSGIKYYFDAETAFQNNLDFASTTLLKAREVFVTARVCNLGYNTVSNFLRSNLINSNVIQNIDGVPNPDSYRTLAQIPWNLRSINESGNISDAHIAVLSTAENKVNSATTPTAVTDAMTPVNSTSFNIDPQKDMVTNIKAWLRGVRDIYSTNQCPINLDKVLSATSTAAFY